MKHLMMVIAFLISVSGLAATWADPDTGIEWAYNTFEGEATITGADPSTGEITIPASVDGCPVTSVGEGAFWRCRWLTSVTIPSSVTSIGECAFEDCSGLMSVTIPSSVTSIGDSTFRDCSGLMSVTIPSSVTSIGSYAFSGCRGLTSVTIPSSVTSIGSDTFYGCSGLTSVTIPSSVTSIGNSAFSCCSGLTSFRVDSANTVYCSINGLLCSKDGTTVIAGVNGDVTIPSGVTSIWNSAFSGCSGLESVAIPSSVTNIGSYAFSGCSGLKSVTIPSSVTSIGGSAFSGTPFYNNYPDGMVILGEGVLYKYKGTCPSSVAIPSTVTSIGDSAFSGCRGLKSVTIPSSVTSIGEEAFVGCDLRVVFVDGTVPECVANYFGEREEGFYQKIGDSIKYYWKSRFVGDSAEVAGVSPSYGDVVVPAVIDGRLVTSIGERAFSGCSGLTSVTIPEGVTSIGERAFEGCSGLTSVTIPSSMTSIGYGVFEGCSGLADSNGCIVVQGVLYAYLGGGNSVTIPEGVVSIGAYAFYDYYGPESVTIPSSVTSIGAYAFVGCDLRVVFVDGTVPECVANYFGEREEGFYQQIGEPIKYYWKCRVVGDTVEVTGVSPAIGDVVIPAVIDGRPVTSIGNYAFSRCRRLTSVSIPSSVTSIGVYAFENCSGLTSVTIPSSVTSIGECAFYGCSGLTSVTIPEGVTSIGNYAFSGCSLESVTIPSSVTSISKTAFTGEYDWYDLGSRVSAFYVSESNAVYSSRNGMLCTKDGTTLLVGGGGEIPEGVVNIDDFALAGCCLYPATIPSSVRSIGAFAFTGCYFEFEDDGESHVLEIPEGVEHIGEGAFWMSGGFDGVVVPSSAASIGDFAFCDCGELCQVTIDEGVSSIGDYAFYGCDELESVTIPSSVISIGNEAFERTPFLDSQPNGMMIFGRVLYRYKGECPSSVMIPEGVTSIGYGTFVGCSGLTSVTIPEGVTSIGSYAFYACSGLTSVTIPLRVTSIGAEAFAWCSGLTSVTIPEGVTSIGYGVFEGCRGLTSVTIPEGVTSIGDRAFSDCSGLKSVTIPSSVTSIGNSAFSGCSGLKSVTIPSSVTSIGEYAFGEDCDGYESCVVYVDKGDKERLSWLMLASVYGWELEEYEYGWSPYGLEDLSWYCYEFSAHFSFVEREVPKSQVAFYRFIKQAFAEKAAVEERTVVTGAKLGELPEVSAEGMTFDGWWTYDETRSDKLDEMYVEQVSSDTVVAGDMTIVGRWTPNTYRIVLDDRGGDVMSPVIPVVYGEVLEPLPTPTRSGYSFAAWKTADGKLFPQDVLEAVDEDEYCYEIADDTVLYADWKENAVTPDDPPDEPDGSMVRVSFVASNGTVAVESLLFPKEGTYGALPEAQREGFTFAGWYVSPTGEKRVSAFDPVDPSVVTLYARWAEDSSSLYAQWEANAYAVSFDANGGVGVMPDQSFFYDQRQDLSPNAFTRVGYSFCGWATSVDGAVVYADGASVLNLTAEVNKPVKLFAVWRVDAEDPVDPPFVPPTLVDEAGTVIDVEKGESAPYEKAVVVYDGYVYDAKGAIVGTIQVKVAKAKVKKSKSKVEVEGEGEGGGISATVTATVQLVGEKKKISFKGGVADATGVVNVMSAGGHELSISLGVNGLGGSMDGKYTIDGARNLFSAKDKEAKDVVKEIESMWVGAINVVGDDVALAVSIVKKGKVKVSGTVNGAKVTATSQLLVGETVCCVPVVITKKATLAFNLWLMADGTVEVVVGGSWFADRGSWFAAAAGTLKTGAKFALGEAAAKGLAALPGLLTEYLPTNLVVAVSGKKWVVAPDAKGKAAKAGKVVFNKKTSAIDEAKLGENPSALKLTYTAKTGSFKGSFKAYTLIDNKVKAYTFNITGVLIGDKAYGTATLKKPAVSVPIVIE